MITQRSILLLRFEKLIEIGVSSDLQLGWGCSDEQEEVRVSQVLRVHPGRKTQSWVSSTLQTPSDLNLGWRLRLDKGQNGFISVSTLS